MEHVCTCLICTFNLFDQSESDSTESRSQLRFTNESQTVDISEGSNEKRDGLLISVSLGASRVTGRISGGSSLGQSKEQTHADTELEASRGLEYQYSQREYRICVRLHLDARVEVHSVGVPNILRSTHLRSTPPASENRIIAPIYPRPQGRVPSTLRVAQL